MKLGEIRLKQFLDRTKGAVRGRLVSDAKNRIYRADYIYTENEGGLLLVKRANSYAVVSLKPALVLRLRSVLGRGNLE